MQGRGRGSAWERGEFFYLLLLGTKVGLSSWGKGKIKLKEKLAKLPR